MTPLADTKFEEFLENQVDVMPCSALDQTYLPTRHSVVDYCFRQITRSSFRRTRIDEESSSNLRQKLEKNISNGKPIAFTVPFGGYKNHRAASFPGPDWAEVFNMNYLARYLLPVVRRYEPGVVLQYTYSSGVMDLVSNIPSICTAVYMEQFLRLISIFVTRLPPNLRLATFDISTLYPPGKLMAELQHNYEDNRARWDHKFSATEQERRISSASRNLMKQGAFDLTALAGTEWTLRCIDAAMWCEALDSLKLRRQYNKYSENIQLVFVHGPRLSVHIGSCETSAHHFWSGCGVIEATRGRLQQRILSGDKLLAHRQEGRVRDVPVNTIFSDVGSAFSQIVVLKREQDW